jgi:hypothetical protein
MDDDGGSPYGFGDGAKENRRYSTMPNVPGAWEEDHDLKDDDEGGKRGGKRAKISMEQKMTMKGEEQVEKVVKKMNRAREAAARNAKERKEGIPGRLGGGKESGGGNGRGILSMARLNMLSRPRERR